MLTVAQRVARAGRDFCYLLLFEGVPWAFCDREELCGSGEFSWVGIDNGDREVLPGLVVPEEVTSSTNMETGMCEGEDGLTFTVVDFDRRLIAYLRSLDDEAETVGERLSPKDSPAPSTLFSSNGEANVSIHGKWMAHEAIGENGERRIFQLFPGDPMPGYDHAALVGDDQTVIGPSAVYEEPTHFVGRKVALYRVFRDTTSGQFTYPYWASFDDSFDSGYGLLWVGTVQELSAEGTRWRIVCDGPSSHLSRPLNVNRPATWQVVSAPLFLKTTPGEREDLIALSCHYVDIDDGTISMGGSSIFDTTDDVLPTTGLLSDILDAIQDRLTAVTADGSADITWTTHAEAVASFVLGYATAKINDGSGYVAVWDLTMHEIVWRAFGYDPKVQKKDGAFEDGFRIDFQPENPDGQVQMGQGWWTCPAPNYYRARFSTIPIGFEDRTDALSDADNNGQVRAWYALTDPGVSLLFPAAKQELDVGIGTNTPYIEGQTNRPPDEHTFTGSGGDADSTGYFALRGKYLTGIDEDPIDMVQVFKGSWRNDSGTYGMNPDSVRQLYIARWLDPRWFGIDRKPLDRVWAVADGKLEMVPFAFLGWNHDYGDRADLVLLRTLLNTGTCEWTGYEGQNPTRTLGDNADPDAAADEGSDVDVADLGLGVYHELVDAASFTAAANELPDGGANSPLNRCKFGFIGAFNSQDLIQRIIEPRGWGLAWSRGQFRLFSRPQALVLEDATVTISSDDLASDDVPYVPAVEMTPLTPKNRFKVSYGAPLVEGVGPENELSLTVRALDAGAKVRHGDAELEIDATGLVPYGLWGGDQGAPPAWQPEFFKLWALTMASWFAAPHVLVKGLPVLYSKGKDIGPGTVVRLTVPFAPTREGAYDLTNRVGRVYRVVHNLADLTSKLDILVQAGDPLLYRRFAPIAWVKNDVTTVEERYDVATRAFYCESDFFGHGSWHDLHFFAEPEGLGVGGDAKVHGYQWDGRSWSQTFSFDVESVSTANDRITYKAGTFSGTFWDARYTFLVMAPYDDQDANSWPRALFSVLTDSTFHFGAGPTKGFKLK